MILERKFLVIMFFNRNENDQRECLGTKKDQDSITMTFDIGPFYFEYNHNEYYTRVLNSEHLKPGQFIVWYLND